MTMDFQGIEDYWFGKVKEPEFPLEPIDLGVGFSNEPIEFRDPERLEFIDPFEERPSGKQDKNQPSEESSGPEGED